MIVHGAMHEAALAWSTLTRGVNRRSAYPSEVSMSKEGRTPSAEELDFYVRTS